MGAHHHEVVSVEEQLEFTAESKRNLLIGMGVGIALVLLGSYLLSQGVNVSAQRKPTIPKQNAAIPIRVRG